MTSTMGGDDPAHDLPDPEKDLREKELRKEGKNLRRLRKPKEARKRFDRAIEISRDKSKTAQHH
jgi:predicted RNA polymerase sigma factor